MKICILNQEKFHLETIDFYKKNFEIVDENEADIIVINNFKPIETGKVVACNSTGIEHIKSPEIISLQDEDLSDFTAVAELCLGMAIYTMRFFKKEEIKGKTLGIFGFGRIGKQLLRLIRPFGVYVFGYDKRANPKKGIDITELTIKSGEIIDMSTKMEDVLCQDIVSLHISATEENRNFIDKEKFAMMKDGAIFLNSARPWLVEEEGLKWALDNKLAGAWIDFQIPLIHPKLIKTTHLGGTTKESTKRSEMLIAQKLKKLYGDK